MAAERNLGLEINAIAGRVEDEEHLDVVIISSSSSSSNTNTNTAVPVLNSPQLPLLPGSARFRGCSEILYYVYVGTLLITYAPLIGLVQVKYQNETLSPFKTHTFFMITSVVALIMAALTSGILFYINHHLKNSDHEYASPVHHVILINVVWFSTILAPLSLVLVLFVPSKLIWIGYSIDFVLFLAIIAYNFIDYIWLRGTILYVATLKLIYSFKEKFEHHSTVV